MNDNKHSRYDAFADKWLKTRSACEGQSAIHNAGEKFLPRLADQSDIDYKNYKLRATYFNATGRTLEGLVGMVFRKAIEKEYPAALEPIFNDLDLKGNSLSAVAMLTIYDLLQVGRAGILVEYPSVSQLPNTRADAATANLRPYTTYYPAESILDWRAARVNNVMQPIMIKLQEVYEIQKNEFEYEEHPQIRALLLTEFGYTQRIYRKDSRGVWAQAFDDIVPLIKGKPIPFIPFWAFGVKENCLDLQEPPILDLADLNIAHYRVTADYERGCHFAGLPTPMLAGFVFDEGEKISIGSSTAIVSSDPAANWGFLEFQGQGLTALEKNLLQKEAQMAAIGARMLAPEKAGVEAAGTLLMRSNGETSVLAALVRLAGENFNKITRFMAEWYGVAGEINIQMNTDFLPVPMSAQDLDALMKAWQVGGLPKEELFYALKQGEVIREATTYDDYILGLEADAVSGMDNLPNAEQDVVQVRKDLGL